MFFLKLKKAHTLRIGINTLRGHGSECSSCATLSALIVEWGWTHEQRRDAKDAD